MAAWGSRLALKYIFFEMLPGFLLGVLVFLLISLMSQTFRLSDLIIIHGADFRIIGQIVLYLALSFMPLIFPMALLFSILMTYGRLSSDSELLMLRSLGMSLPVLSIPAVVLSLGVAVLSAEISFTLAPWGNRELEVLIHRLSQSKPGIGIQEGVFSEGFFDLVVYANKVDSRSGALSQIFIHDERNENSPLTIIARDGQLVQEKTNDSQKAFLRLKNGNIHRSAGLEEAYTKIDFESFDIFLQDQFQFSTKEKSALSYSLNDLRSAIRERELDSKKILALEIEMHRRWAMAVACLAFAVLGVALGTKSNRRSAKGSGLVLSLITIVSYWILYASMESLAKTGVVPVWLCIWFPDIATGGVAALTYYKSLDA